MFRVALIIAALVSGHHHVVITHQDGKGFMATGFACSRSSQLDTPRRGIVCATPRFATLGHLAVKSVFARTTAAANNGVAVNVRRAYIFNAKGKLAGWVDWTRGAHLIGHVILKDGPAEAWQEGR